MNFFLIAQANAQGTPPLSIFSSMLPMILMIVAVFYFLVYRPQQKEQKKTREMINTMKKGNKVVTAGGIHGTVAGIKDDVILVKVYEDVKIEVSKSHITVVKK